MEIELQACRHGEPAQSTTSHAQLCTPTADSVFHGPWYRWGPLGSVGSQVASSPLQRAGLDGVLVRWELVLQHALLAHVLAIVSARLSEDRHGGRQMEPGQRHSETTKCVTSARRRRYSRYIVVALEASEHVSDENSTPRSPPATALPIVLSMSDFLNVVVNLGLVCGEHSSRVNASRQLRVRASEVAQKLRGFSETTPQCACSDIESWRATGTASLDFCSCACCHAALLMPPAWHTTAGSCHTLRHLQYRIAR